MTKKILYSFLIIPLLFASLFVFFKDTYADSSFYNNFDDSNADGWWFGYSHAVPSIFGNWRVDDGTLVQDTGYDGVLALVEDKDFYTQVVGTNIKLNGPSGGGGIVLWYQNDDNLVFVMVYPAANFIEVSESYNNNWNIYHYNDVSLSNYTWYDLKVDANSVNGILKVYLNDDYLFTYNVVSENRFGQFGVFNGNAGGYFDNFRVGKSAKVHCNKKGWITNFIYDFKNQGECLKFVSLY